MSDMQPSTVDLVITSPPYDNLRSYDGGFVIDVDSIVENLHRVMRPGGVVVWVVGDATINKSETGSSFRQALKFMSGGFLLHDTMIWEKTGTNYPAKGRYTQMFEFMFVFSKGRPKTFNPICDEPKLWEGSWGKTSTRNKDGTLTYRELDNEGLAISGRDVTGRWGYKQRSNIWKITNGKRFSTSDEIAYKHPAIFPEKLAADHIKSWSNEGDLVLDPMCGSGTVPKMAKRLSRRFIGIDISENYCYIARRRVENI